MIGTRDRTGTGRVVKKDEVSYQLGRYNYLGLDIKKWHPAIKLIMLDELDHLTPVENFQSFHTALENAVTKQKK